MNIGERIVSLLGILLLLFWCGQVSGAENSLRDSIYDVGPLKPIDSELKVAPGEVAPDFTLPAISGKNVSLSSLKGRNVVISFVPAAWTPVCSDQWPGYGISRNFFDENDAVLLGVTVDAFRAPLSSGSRGVETGRLHGHSAGKRSPLGHPIVCTP